MSQSPTFSILVPAYNAEATLPATLDSILAQSRDDWEAIVVDDGSNDGTARIAGEYAARDPRFKAISKANGGTASARNVAARAALAPFFALLDGDDLYLPKYLECVGRFIEEHPGFDIYSVDGFLMFEDGEVVPDDLHPDSEVRSYVAEDLLVRNRIRVHNVFRREVFDLVGGFDEDRRMAMEDYDFWLRALLAGARHIHDPERLKVYRVSKSAKTGDALVCHRSDEFMFRKILDTGTLSARRSALARKSLRELSRGCAILEGGTIREDLQRRLDRGDTRSARTLYLRSWRGWSDKAKYAAGLALIVVSPRLFARVVPGLTASRETPDPPTSSRG